MKIFKTMMPSAVSLIALLSFMVAGFDADAATITVTSNADSGAGTLRAALSSYSAGDTINFALPAGSETINVGSVLPTISNAVSIDGSNTEPGGSGTKVAVQVPSPGISAWRVFYVNSSTGGAVTFSNMTVKGGYISTGMAGAIQINAATVNMTGVTISDSRACQGGAIHVNTGNLTINSSTIVNNATNKSGACESHGGFIYNLGGTLNVYSSVISGNSALCGGAIFNATGNGKLTVISSDVSGNSGACGGGVYNEGTATISASTIGGNLSTGDGGGILSWGNLAISSSTIAGNSARYGGGIFKGGTLSAVSSTISGNTSTGNKGGGINNNGGASSLLSTIVINNIASAGADIYVESTGGSSASAYFSWFNSTIGSIGEQESAPNMKRAFTAGDLGSLADNGGLTKTMAVSPSAPAAGRGAFAYYNATDGYYFLDNKASPVSHKLTNWGTSPAVNPSDKITSDQRGVTREDPTTIGSYYVLPAYFKITGHVYLGGTGLPGVTVGDGISKTTTGDDGSYSLTGFLNYSSATVTPSMTGGYTFTPASASVTIPGADAINIDFNVVTASLAMVSDPVAGGSTTPAGTVSVALGVKQDISAAPTANYHFDHWAVTLGTGGIDDPTGATTKVSISEDSKVTAYFAINTYNLDYTAGPNGSLTGNKHQVVDYGMDGTAVTAVADPGYEFVKWSDESTQNPRQDKNVTANLAVSASFTKSMTATTTSLGATPNPGKTGIQVTFTATVAPGDATGIVVFVIDVAPVASVPLNSGTAEYHTDSLTVGSHTVKAVYGGDASYMGSESAPLTQYVDKEPTIIKNPGDQTATYGDTVIFPSDATGTPTPTIQWQVSKDGGSTWDDLNGETGKILTFTAQGPQNGYKYRAVYTNRAGTDTTLAATLTVSKAAATVNLSNLTQTYDGSPRPVTISTTPSGLTVIATYDGSTTAPTNVKPGGYAVAATISDPNYQGSNSGTLTINKASATVNLNSLTQSYDGNPKPVTVETVPSGLTVAVTYDGSATPPTNVKAGGYAVVATVNENNYSGAKSGTLVISKGAATVTLGNLSQTYNGTPRSATAVTTPAGLTVNITYDSYANPPTSAGNYSVVGTISDENYQGSDTGTLVIAKATAPVAFEGLVQTYNGTPRFVTAVTTPAGLAVGITYDGSTTAPTNAGNYAVVGTVSDANYNGSGNGTLEVHKAVAIVALGNLSQTYDGTPRIATATTTPAGFTVGITYNGSPIPPVNAGIYAVVGTVIDMNYQGSSEAPMVVSKAATSVSLWSTPNPSCGGVTVAFTSGVSSTEAGVGTPTGEVAFKDGTTVLGTGAISGGTALYSTPGLSAGSRSITAVYAGDFNFAGNTSAPVIQVVGAPLVVNTQPANMEGCSGASMALSVMVTGDAPIHYQWYKGSKGDTGTPVGKDSSELTVSGPNAGGNYWVRASNSCGQVDSSAATVTLDTPPVILNQPMGRQIQSGETATITVAAEGIGTLHYAWYQGLSGDTTKPVGTDSAVFMTAPLESASSYWVAVSNACGKVSSTAAVITVSGGLVVEGGCTCSSVGVDDTAPVWDGTLLASILGLALAVAYIRRKR